ncbi:heterokaryon incompatibility protein-domain-containing protein [Fomes fomentarius]|nr:heterokaryon incompatibility protein-domain-containing protein [Fomes fomentarius]
MRLLNTKTYHVKHFMEDDRPPYAILSHRWGDEEVTFADMKDLKLARKRKGWLKVEEFCRVAARDGYEWGWDDTCCIDKSSSAELSEAINSMYAWYSEAQVCYAFLDDVPDSSRQDPTVEASSFRKSKWFERGWTLQELIAPTVVFLMSQNWQRLGTKRFFAETIEQITGIDRAVLIHERFLDDVSVARRMSWAARRRTTLVEDRAYSLMGIFGVNMPTIYGEREKAFVRLQLEIIRQSPDQSIFAWGTMIAYQDLENNKNSLSDHHEWASGYRCLLASEPGLFASCENIEPISIDGLSTQVGVSIDSPEFYPTNYGISIHLPIHTAPTKIPTQLALLACRDSSNGNIVAVLIRRMKESPNRHYVGMYGLNRPLRHPWHPYFRVISIPITVLNKPRVMRVYLHSHNVNPQRSHAQGFDDKQLVLHAPDSKSQARAKQYRFFFEAWLLRDLLHVGFRVAGWNDDQAAKDGFKGWTPMSYWRQQDQRLSVTFSWSPSMPIGQYVPRYAVILFRRKRTSSAFAVILGIWGTDPDLSCSVVIKLSKDDLPEWNGMHDHDLAKSIWHAVQGRPLSDGKVGGQSWEKGTRTFWDARQAGKVKVSLTPWLTREEANVVGTDTITYSVGLELEIGDAMLEKSSDAERVEGLSGLSSLVAH